MSFTNPAPVGGYATGDLIDESEINYWCTALPDCVDGAGGGTYALSNPLTITGDVVTFDDLVVNDDLTISGDTIIGSASADTLIVNATTTFDNDVTIGSSTADTFSVLAHATMFGNLTVNGNTVLGNASGDTLTVTATATFENGVTIGSSSADALGVNSTATFNNDVTIGASVADSLGVLANTTIFGTLGFSGTGRMLVTFQNVTTGSTSVDVTQKRFVILSASLSGTQTTTLTGTPISGDWFVVQNADAASQTLAGVVSGPIDPNTGAMYIYDGSGWITAMVWAI